MMITVKKSKSSPCATGHDQEKYHGTTTSNLPNGGKR